MTDSFFKKHSLVIYDTLMVYTIYRQDIIDASQLKN